MKIAVLAAALLLPVLAAAQSEPIFHMQPEPDFAQVLNAALLPLQPKDAFVGLPACGILDAKLFQAYTLPEAVQALRPCLSAVSARYAIPLKDERGVVATLREGRGAVLGIVLTAGVQSKVGSAMVRDLGFSLSQRGGQLLGFKTVVRAENDPAPAVPSTAQEAIDRCVMPMVIRSIESGADFIKFYGGCLRRAPELKVEDLKPWSGHQLGVMILTDAEGPTAEGINGAVVVTGAKGLVTVDLVAYPKHLNLP